MNQGTAKLIIDLGNSETRIMVMHGKKNGVFRRKLKSAPNQYAQHDATVKPQGAVAQKSFQFISNGEVKGEQATQEYVGGHVVPREYANTRIEPRSIQRKYESLTTLLALHIAFFKGYQAVAELNGYDIEDVEVDWEVTVLIPPADVDLGSAEIASIIRSIKKINFTLPEKLEKDIEIVEFGITVLSEGHSAFVGVAFKSSTELREGYESLLNEKVLIVDIGAGTTDFLVIDSGLVVESTKFTEETGGNNIMQVTRSNLRKKDGLRLPVSAVKQGITTGEVRDGSQVRSIVGEIADAKNQVSFTLISALNDFFDQTGFNPRTINSMLVVGGGSIKSEVAGIQPISDYLVKQLRSYSPNIALVETPTESRELPDGTTEVREINPRLLNILGAGVQSEN